MKTVDQPWPPGDTHFRTIVESKCEQTVAHIITAGMTYIRWTLIQRPSELSLRHLFSHYSC